MESNRCYANYENIPSSNIKIKNAFDLINFSNKNSIGTIKLQNNNSLEQLREYIRIKKIQVPNKYGFCKPNGDILNDENIIIESVLNENGCIFIIPIYAFKTSVILSYCLSLIFIFIENLAQRR